MPDKKEKHKVKEAVAKLTQNNDWIYMSEKDMELWIREQQIKDKNK